MGACGTDDDAAPILMIILITEPNDYSKKAIALYRSLGPVYFLPELKGKRMEDVMKKTNILVIRLAYIIDKPWMKKMPALKIIATNTTGLNHIDTIEAKKRGIKVISLRGRTNFLKDIPSTAEETIGLLLSLVRNLPWAFDHVKSGKWQRDMFKGNQLIGKILGIIGLGRIGKMVARFARIFGMSIIAYDPYLSSDVFKRNNAKRAGALTEIIKKSDIISLHPSLHLTDEKKRGKIFRRNVGMIHDAHFKIMKPSVYVINTARGELMNEQSILKALKQRYIKGAALDVLWNEQGDGSHLKNNPLVAYARKNKNLIIVPHLGGATYEAMQITEEFIADLVKKYFSRKKK